MSVFKSVCLCVPERLHVYVCIIKMKMFKLLRLLKDRSEKE